MACKMIYLQAAELTGTAMTYSLFELAKEKANKMIVDAGEESIASVRYHGETMLHPLPLFGWNRIQAKMGSR